MTASITVVTFWVIIIIVIINIVITIIIAILLLILSILLLPLTGNAYRVTLMETRARRIFIKFTPAICDLEIFLFMGLWDFCFFNYGILVNSIVNYDLIHKIMNIWNKRVLFKLETWRKWYTNGGYIQCNSPGKCFHSP